MSLLHSAWPYIVKAAPTPVAATPAPVDGSDPLHPRPAQTLPGSLGSATDSLIGWSITAALIACTLGFIMGWAFVGVGNNTERPELAARGKKSVMWSLIAAAGIGATFALLKAFYGLGA